MRLLGNKNKILCYSFMQVFSNKFLRLFDDKGNIIIDKEVVTLKISVLHIWEKSGAISLGHYNSGKNILHRVIRLIYLTDILNHIGNKGRQVKTCRGCRLREFPGRERALGSLWSDSLTSQTGAWNHEHSYDVKSHTQPWVKAMICSYLCIH